MEQYIYFVSFHKQKTIVDTRTMATQGVGEFGNGELKMPRKIKTFADVIGAQQALGRTDGARYTIMSYTLLRTEQQAAHRASMNGKPIQQEQARQ